MWLIYQLCFVVVREKSIWYTSVRVTLLTQWLHACFNQNELEAGWGSECSPLKKVELNVAGFFTKSHELYVSLWSSYFRAISSLRDCYHLMCWPSVFTTARWKINVKQLSLQIVGIAHSVFEQTFQVDQCTYNVGLKMRRVWWQNCYMDSRFVCNVRVEISLSWNACRA